MPEIYFRDRLDGTAHNVLISEGRMLIFSLRGVFEGEKPFDFSKGALIPVDVLSILQVGTEYEFAMVYNRVFYKKKLGRDVPAVLAAMGALTGMLFVSTRKGVTDEIPYTQYIYAFRENRLSPDWLNWFK